MAHLTTRPLPTVSAPPCGHCRQFLNELRYGREIRVVVPSYGIDCALDELLPHGCAAQQPVTATAVAACRAAHRLPT